METTMAATATRPAPLLTDAQLAQYHRDGFLVGPKVVDDQWLGELRAEIDRVIAGRKTSGTGREGQDGPTWISNMGGEETPVWQIVNIWASSDAFKRLLNIPGLAACVATMLDARELRLWHDQIQYKPSGRGGVNRWHQDWPYWPPMSDADAMTAWIALDDAAADNGCMSMVPGSHQWGNAISHLHEIKEFTVPSEYQGHSTVAQLCPVPAGHVHFHHSLTWHGSHANTSQRPRRAIALHFMSERVKHDSSKGHLVSRYIESADGQTITGAGFPLVFRNGAEVRVPVGPA